MNIEVIATVLTDGGVWRIVDSARREPDIRLNDVEAKLGTLINEVQTKLNTRFSEVETELGARIDAVNNSIDLPHSGTGLLWRGKRERCREAEPDRGTGGERERRVNHLLGGGSSGPRRGAMTGLEAIAKRFRLQRSLLVGAGVAPLNEFLAVPAGHWFEEA